MSSFTAGSCLLTMRKREGSEIPLQMLECLRQRVQTRLTSILPVFVLYFRPWDKAAQLPSPVHRTCRQGVGFFFNFLCVGLILNFLIL